MKEYKYKINVNNYTVSVGEIDGDIAQVEVNGVPYNVEIKTEKKAPVAVKSVKPNAPAAPTQKVVKAAAKSAAGTPVKSPLPGVIVDIKVAVGDTVAPDTLVVVLEAMKMENNINAGVAGVVKSIDVAKGDSVLEGTTILVIG